MENEGYYAAARLQGIYLEILLTLPCREGLKSVTKGMVKIMRQVGAYVLEHSPDANKLIANANHLLKLSYQNIGLTGYASGFTWAILNYLKYSN